MKLASSFLVAALMALPGANSFAGQLKIKSVTRQTVVTGESNGPVELDLLSDGEFIVSSEKERSLFFRRYNSNGSAATESDRGFFGYEYRRRPRAFTVTADKSGGWVAFSEMQYRTRPHPNVVHVHRYRDVDRPAASLVLGDTSRLGGVDRHLSSATLENGRYVLVEAVEGDLVIRILGSDIKVVRSRVEIDKSGAVKTTAVAALTNGNFVAAWALNDGTVQAQVFDRLAATLVPEFTVGTATLTNGSAISLDVEPLPEGGFQVLRESVQGATLSLQAFDAAGNPVRGELTFPNMSPSYSPSLPLETFQSGKSIVGYAAGSKFRVLTTAGQPSGSERTISSATPQFDVLALDASNFVVAWVKDRKTIFQILRLTY